MFHEMVRVLAEKMKPFVDSLGQQEGGHSATGSTEEKLPYAILGVDFLFSGGGSSRGKAHECHKDEPAGNKLQGWLIEFNYSPCLYDTAPFTNSIKQELAEDMVTEFVEPNLGFAAGTSVVWPPQVNATPRFTLLLE